MKGIVARIGAPLRRAILWIDARIGTRLHKATPWLLLACLAAAVWPLFWILFFPSQRDLLHIPFASWSVFLLSGAILLLDGIALDLWWTSRTAHQKLVALRGEPIREDIPAVRKHDELDQAEFLPVVQTLLRRLSNARYVQVTSLPGGYGGSATVLVVPEQDQSVTAPPQSYVVKLGDRREMTDEHTKYETYVQKQLTGAAEFVGHAEWGDTAGIAYEFAGSGRSYEIRSFHQFYQGSVAVEVANLVNDVYKPLRRAWYRHGQSELVDLRDEYRLLRRKREHIIAKIEEITDRDDHDYRLNFSVGEARLQPNTRPSFCPDIDITWHDPVAFLRTWRSRANLTMPIHRSTVHGDFHARNVLVGGVGKRGRRDIWFIDFSHTGNGLTGHRTQEAIDGGMPIDPHKGHTLRDFCRLEADVKFILTRLEDDEADLELAVAFERELLRGEMALHALPTTPPPTRALLEERFRKAWMAIREIRQQATKYLVNEGDLRPYYMGLLHASLPIVYYHPDQFKDSCERQQKRYALIASGMLCGRL